MGRTEGPQHAERDEDHAGDDQRGDRHARDRVVGRPDDADDAGAHGDEEEAEDDLREAYFYASKMEDFLRRRIEKRFISEAHHPYTEGKQP